MRTEQALLEFFASRTAANLSKETITWYRNRLLPFARACPTLARRPEPIELFLSNMTGSHETKWDVYRALKTFYKFIESRRRFPNPMKDIKAPRRPKLVMPTLESGEIMKLLQSVDVLRDRAILTLIIDTGVRAGEVCSLLKQNIRQETVIVKGKIGWREVPISEETRSLLLQAAAASPYEYVFHNSKGRQIGRHSIYDLVRKYLTKACIKGPKLGPHRLRHAFGKNFLVQGGDLRSLQEIMGHADIETTQKYASLNLNDIVRKHRLFSPLRAVRTAENSELLDPDEALREAEAILLKAKGRRREEEGDEQTKS
jgi:site-specific recombinase XerD